MEVEVVEKEEVLGCGHFTKSPTASLDVGIPAQKLELALTTPNSIIWMVLALSQGNLVQYHTTFAPPT